MSSPPEPPSHFTTLRAKASTVLRAKASASVIARQGIERDAEITHDISEPIPIPTEHDELSIHSNTGRRPSGSYAMAGSFMRTSGFAGPGRSTMLPSMQIPDSGFLNNEEQDAARQEERSLLRDNDIIPPKHPRRSVGSMGKNARSKSIVSSLRRKASRADEEAVVGAEDEIQPSEDTPLLGPTSQLPYGGEDTPANIDKKWEEAVAAGLIQTTWKREAKVLARYSRSLILTFLLQFSLPVTSVFFVGHLGKIELGAVSLATMTANITGYAIYQGLATSLDTLCAQAYGSGHKKLVGLQMQRMVFFLWVVTIPIGIVWFNAAQILRAIVPERETAEYAGQYLKIVLLGAPAYAAFEGGKRYVQAQGIFTANLYVLLFAAPLNVLLHWVFVVHMKLGFVGAPIAVAITENALPVCLLLYVYYFASKECWGGFTKAAFTNWGPMVKLALPGVVMVLAEFLAFEILTLVASYISAEHLAAQSVLSTVSAIAYSIPFPIGIATSTRVANLIGATLAPAAKKTGHVALCAAFVTGCINMVVLSVFRKQLPRIFTDDEDVIALVAKTLPVCAAFQLFDAFAAIYSGILRGIGRQEVGGYVALFAYYVVAMPISMSTAFLLHWELAGLWFGCAVALFLVAFIEGVFVHRTDWNKAVEAAQKRNVM